MFLTLIVFTGAAVRLTGSGLGCPDWPKCYGKVAPPLETHAFIEFGNRLLSGLVGLAAVAAGLLAFRRRPFRRDLALIGAPAPARRGRPGRARRLHGAQPPRARLRHGPLRALHAHPHRRRRRSPGAPATSRASARARSGPLGVWAVRGLLPLGAVTIFVGTAATAAGPHAGGAGTGDEIDRLEWRGADDAGLGGAPARPDRDRARGRRRGRVAAGAAAGADPEVQRRADGDVRAAGRRRAPWAGCSTLLELPAELVWIHVALAATTWLALLWATLAAGPPRRPAPAPRARGRGRRGERVPVSSADVAPAPPRSPQGAPAPRAGLRPASGRQVRRQRDLLRRAALLVLPRRVGHAVAPLVRLGAADGEDARAARCPRLVSCRRTSGPTRATSPRSSVCSSSAPVASESVPSSTT